jgi:hypothetical protein
LRHVLRIVPARMNRQHIAIATMTLAKNEQDERPLLDALQRLALDRWPVAVSDGGSRPAFVRALASLPSFTLVAPRAPGLVGQIKASVADACRRDAPFILYTEPDKFEFFDEHLAAFVDAAPDAAGIGIVLAARSPASFDTFPAFQRDTEGTFNRVCAEIVGEQTDYLYGPFLMNRAVAAHLDTARDDIGWGWRPFLFAEARRLGYRVVPIAADLPCPPEQRTDDRDERLHRIRQLRENIDGLLLSACR